jgi:hypothetical protein
MPLEYQVNAQTGVAGVWPQIFQTCDQNTTKQLYRAFFDTLAIATRQTHGEPQRQIRRQIRSVMGADVAKP